MKFCNVPGPKKQVLKYCSENMETFMVPKYIEFMDSLPKTANGKIDKKQLKAKAEASVSN